MIRTQCLAFLLVVTAAASSSRAAGTALDVKASGPKTFYVNSRAGNSQVTVLSESTLEDFTTVCNQVAGECRVDPRNLESLSGRFSLKVADMRTGISLRDEHLRGDDWLNASAYPQIIIEVSRAERAKKTGPNTASMTLACKCTIRDQTRPVMIPCTLTYLDESPTTMKVVKGDLIRLRAEFELKLSDFGISGPKGSETIGMKVSDVQKIKISVFAATQAPPKSLSVDKESPAPSPDPKQSP